MLNGLDGGVVMVLMDLTINYLLGILLFRSEDSLVLDSWIHRLVDSGLMLPILGEEVRNGCLGFIHFMYY